MDLHLELEPEELLYLYSQGITEGLPGLLTEALRHIVTTKPSNTWLALAQAMGRTEERNVALVRGYPVTCEEDVSLCVGPVMGEVTQSKAVILLEVKSDLRARMEITCELYKKGTSTVLSKQTIIFSSRSPRAFVFQEETETGLEADTEYVAVFHGLNVVDAPRAFALFKTKPETIKNFRIIAFSCDRPDRMFLGQKNPWYDIAKRSYKTDVILHLGDQVYNKGEDNDKTCQLFGEEYEAMDDTEKKLMKKRGRALLAKKYRETWNKKATRSSLQQGCHLMIWSDNDVANDFTTMKDQSGEQAYPPAFLQVGIEMYRDYQRLLWDTDLTSGKKGMPADDEYFKEYHSHVYGPVGIFMMDIRGNRITGDGVQHSDNNLVSDDQWESLENFFQTEGLRVIVIANEIPFVGDDPESIIEKAEKVDFLKDHWPYNLEDLVRILDLSFGWKSEDEDNREVILLGGDIHIGVTSQIHDKKTDLTLTHLTTSPVTNHVTKFFPNLTGDINKRYSYQHLPLGETSRNYAMINISIEPELSVTAQLEPVSTNMFKIKNWLSDDEGEE